MKRSSKPYMQFLATLLSMIRECNQTLNGAETLLKQRVFNIILATEVVVLTTGQKGAFFSVL